jgi:hypothetical protein
MGLWGHSKSKPQNFTPDSQKFTCISECKNTFSPFSRVPKFLTIPALLKSPSLKSPLRFKANAVVSPCKKNQKESYIFSRYNGGTGIG